VPPLFLFPDGVIRAVPSHLRKTEVAVYRIAIPVVILVPVGIIVLVERTGGKRHIVFFGLSQHLASEQPVQSPSMEFEKGVPVMKLSTAIVVGGGAALGVLLVVAFRFGYHRRKRPLEIRTEDLTYQEHSPEELAAEHLLDLNTASDDELLRLALNPELTDRIVQNRPYRNKLDLLSRMVIPEEVYSAIKNKIAVAKATESIKFAG
jgi:DNA uptake protein ComE-like DNA-binding protein